MKSVKTKVYLHGCTETAAQQASRITRKLGYEEYGPEYDKIYQAIFFNELEVTVEIDPETLKGNVTRVERIS